MRNWTIISQGETTAELDADRLELREDGIVAFFVGTDLVGVVRDWSTVTSDPTGNLPEVGDPFEAFPADARVNPEPCEGSTMPDEDESQETMLAHLEENLRGTDPDQSIEDFEATGLVVDLASEPDAPGVSDDPIPEPEPALEDVADAIPPDPSPSESTGADDPPAEGGGEDDSAESDRLSIAISEYFAQHSRQQILVDFVNWCSTENHPPQLPRMTIADKRAALAWFEEHDV